MMIIGHSYNHQDAVRFRLPRISKVILAWAGAVGKTSKNVVDWRPTFHQGVLSG